MCSQVPVIQAQRGFSNLRLHTIFCGYSQTPTAGRTWHFDFCVWVLSGALGSTGKAEIVKERDPLWLCNCPNMHILNVNIMLKKCHVV